MQIIFEQLNEFLQNDEEHGKVKDLLDLPYEKFVDKLKDSNDPKIDAIMNLGKKDGINGKVKVTKEKYGVKELTPTQDQISLDDSLGWIGNHRPKYVKEFIKGDTSELNNYRILTANGKYIIDGHHRWIEIFLLNPEAKIPSINLEIPGIDNPEELLRIVQLAIASTYNKVEEKKAKSGTNIFDESVMSSEQLKEKLPEIVGKKFLKLCKKAYEKKLNKDLSKEDVINFINDNATKLKEYKPINAPDRIFMPQPSASAKAAGKNAYGVYGLPIDFIKNIKQL